MAGIPDDIQALEMRSGRLPRNTRVTVIGHPYHIEPWSTLLGEIRSYNPNNPTIAIGGDFARGISGGPVINSKNQIIGMMESISMNFDIAVSNNAPHSNIIANKPAASSVGFAYRIEIVMDKLYEWGIIN